MRTRSIAVIICLVLSVISGYSLASQPSSPKNEIGASFLLEVPDSVKLYEAFNIRFSVNVTDEVEHFNQALDKIKITIPQCCEVDSGSLEWRGELRNRSNVQLSVRLRATGVCRDFIEAGVYTGSLLSDSSMFLTHSIVRSRTIVIHEDARSILRPDSASDVRIMEQGLAPASNRLELLKLFDSSLTGVMATEQLSKPACSTLYHEISLDSVRSGSATITYRAGFENLLGISVPELDSNREVRHILPERWNLISTSGEVRKSLYRGWLVIVLDDPKGVVQLVIWIQGERYLVRINI